MNKRQFRLVHEEARRRAVECVMAAPQGYVVTVQEKVRTLDQNALLHVRLTELGKLLGWKWNGFDCDVEALKRIFMVAYRKARNEPARMLPGIDGEPVVIDWRTSGLSVRECSDVIELINAWEAENVPETPKLAMIRRLPR